MTKSAVSRPLPYAVALTLVSAAAATLTVAVAGDMVAPKKDQARHPDLAANSDEHGMRKDVEILPMPGNARDVIVALANGRYLVQRYYPSGYSVVFKPHGPSADAVADGADRTADLPGGPARPGEHLIR